MEFRRLETDVVIIGGGTAGCYAALTLGEQSSYKILILEKANIERSGCLAAGVNALNAYITKGQTPQDYVNYATKDAAGIVREDLLFSMSQRLNKVTRKLEALGLVILKDEQGEYVARGNRNIKINGENIKSLLADAVYASKNVQVLNQVNAIDYKVVDGKVAGAYAIGVEEEIFYHIKAKVVICATGGASGIYKPNNPGFSRHKMWYSPFNTGAGYAMGIRAGAEMTTFEMRFIALRCKDTISPTGTIAQGLGAKQINSLGEVYEIHYGNTTSERVYGTVKENEAGRGPCYLKTEGISEGEEQELLKAYLNMSPAQTLKWIEGGKGPSRENVEIEGTEPYIVGGHTASGYWVAEDRSTTLSGLFAAGDVAGGCPQKYVTGALAEGEIAAEAAIAYIEREYMEQEGEEKMNNRKEPQSGTTQDNDTLNEIDEALLKYEEVKGYIGEKTTLYKVEEVEEAMQKVMDTYAGGISVGYRYNEKQLLKARDKINALVELSRTLKVKDMYELMKLYELIDRLQVAQVLIEHLRVRKETRWHSFAEHTDYPEQDDKWLKYVNSKKVNGNIEIILRDLVRRSEHYEHTN
ncbi:adenylyl-sulfate reductase subunit alpha [Cellulosilyticum sp. ST5]|uniref:adenylyl-sulfate reductase subunit alpha n=1 Tax=unclassified Cellulosilyticum TaxID=2643091 RepID=UPI000F8DA272|nr:adenylyl-sulfate reductase subunit alpha [Cellulosilyticum sp. WCF-2]QEH67477.1 adenylyl-sulfate reductase subunit alpha [Cellulosilyticum sp. WCF-2]